MPNVFFPNSQLKKNANIFKFTLLSEKISFFLHNKLFIEVFVSTEGKDCFNLSVGSEIKYCIGCNRLNSNSKQRKITPIFKDSCNDFIYIFRTDIRFLHLAKDM